MQSSALDIILSSAACRGAFKMHGANLEPLPGSKDQAGEHASKTRDLWASLGTYVSDAGLMIAKRDNALSIASHRGGLILEASGPVNIGILKAALQSEDAVRPDAPDATFNAAGPAARAQWQLARWIEGTETQRLLVIEAGSDTVELIARKGRFELTAKMTPADIAAIFQTAASAGAPINMTIGDLTTDPAELAHDPIEILCQTGGDAPEWTFDADGRVIAAPKPCSLNEAADVAQIAQRVVTWGDGNPVEVTVVRDGAGSQVIARSNGDNHVQFSIPTE